MSESDDLRNQVEALLFSSGRAMSVEDIANVVEVERRYVKKALVALKEWYNSLEGGLIVLEEGDLWKLSIKENYVSIVTKIVSDTELSKTVLETLSVIAWKSPVLQSEVIKIRTTNAYDHIKELVDAGFITKEKAGRSYKLKISEKFYEYFDVPGDKGIKAAFEEVKIPEKKEPEEIKKVGDLDVVPINNDSVEHGKTAQIFGTDQVPKPEGEEEELAPQPSPIDDVEDPKSSIPDIDNNFLDKLDEQIGKMSKKNDELDNDELFKRKEEESESEETEEEQSSEDTSTSEAEPVSESESEEGESAEDEDVDDTETPEEDSEEEKVVDEYEESTDSEAKSEVEDEAETDAPNEEDTKSDEETGEEETPEDENAEKELDDESTGELSEELEESEKEMDSEIEDESSDESEEDTGEDEKKDNASS